MFAMRLHSPRTPLQWEELPDPTPGPGQIRVKVLACGVCRTDLHVVDGDLTHPKLPVTPGHEIIGRVDLLGSGVTSLTVGQRVGIPWLGHTCGHCSYCATDHENLCDHPIFTGYTRDGGYATMAVADAHFAFPMGEEARTSPSPPCSVQADRVALTWQNGQCPESWAVWLWGSGPYYCAGAGMAKTRGLCLYPPQ